MGYNVDDIVLEFCGYLIDALAKYIWKGDSGDSLNHPRAPEERSEMPDPQRNGLFDKIWEIKFPTAFDHTIAFCICSQVRSFCEFVIPSWKKCELERIIEGSKHDLIYDIIESACHWSDFDSSKLTIPEEKKREWYEKLFYYNVKDWTPCDDDRAFPGTHYENNLHDCLEFQAYELKREIRKWIEETFKGSYFKIHEGLSF
jgi:hypothetical protein